MAHETIGRYALHSPISSGGMASVHYGRLLGPIGFSRTVAIKRLHADIANDPQHTAMFLDEARLSARIHHPNVVATLDIVEAGTELLLVMDYVSGPSLSALARIANEQFEPIPAAHTVSILLGALHGLHAAHEAKGPGGEPLEIVHRDVSPQNILIGDDGVARLIDFGIAKASERLHNTRGTEIRGKILYMAPEQLSRKPVDRRADVYAIAVVLWELLAGRRLVELGDIEDPVIAIDVVRGHQPGPPSHFAPTLPKALDAVVMKGLVRDPAQRYQTALEMATALEAALAPSSQREVGAWVTRVAGEMLRERAAILREIENHPQPAASVNVKMSLVPSMPSSRGAYSMPTDIPTGEVWQQGAPPPRPFDARPWVFAAAVIAVVVAGVVYTYRTPPAPVVIEQPPPTPVASLPTLPAAVPTPTPVPTPTTAPTPTEAPVTMELSSDDSSASAAASAQKQHRPKPPKANNCNPPYTMDHGIKVPKPECK